jgi:transcriptional regulator with XRE-family HTH domain
VGRKQDIFIRFGKRIRKLRKARGFSQETFATHCGLDRTYIGGIERGERNISLRNIEIIAKALNKTISELTRDLEHEDENG